MNSANQKFSIQKRHQRKMEVDFPVLATKLKHEWQERKYRARNLN